MAITFFGPAFQRVHLASGLMTLLMRSYNPAVHARRFGLFRFRSPLLSESRLISLPPGTEMVHFPGFARAPLCIQRAVSRVHRDGFPHSEIPGSKPACGSPGLIAACHVLHRLLAPRHSPYALSSLTIKLTQHVAFLRSPEIGARTAAQCQSSSPFHIRFTTRAELAVYTETHPHGLRRGVIALLRFSCQRTLFPTPGGGLIGFGTASATNKKPGAERRASPSTVDRLARNSDCFYPVLMINGTSNGNRSVLNNRRPPNARDCRHQRSIPVFPDSSSPFANYFWERCGKPKGPRTRQRWPI
jgi:hypothetical protein